MSATTPAPGMTLAEFFEALAATAGDRWGIWGGCLRSWARRDEAGYPACPIIAVAQVHGLDVETTDAQTIGRMLGLPASADIIEAADDHTHPLRPRLLAACGLGGK